MADALLSLSMRRLQVHAHGDNRPDQIDEGRVPKTCQKYLIAEFERALRLSNAQSR